VRHFLPRPQLNPNNIPVSRKNDKVLCPEKKQYTRNDEGSNDRSMDSKVIQI